MKLNPEQNTAVLHDTGPILVIAGAGSGKTRVITNRIVRLVKQKKSAPSGILAITFTNKAAREMRDRIRAMAGAESASAMCVSTFHSLGLRIIRENAPKLGLGNGFSICDDSDRFSLISRLTRTACPRNMKPDKKLIMRVKYTIDMAKNNNITADEYEAEDDEGEVIRDVFLKHEKHLRDNRTLDFNDLLVYPLTLFKEFPDILEKYQKQFRYISVDEYQDTNELQFGMVRMLAGKTMNICAVGDDDQAIYGWRGANIKNILAFERSFPGARIVRLLTNYRSTGQILKAANSVISRNSGRKVKELVSFRGDGEGIGTFGAENEEAEASWICRKIKSLVSEDDFRYSDFAMLLRTNAMTRTYESVFRENGLPYRIRGGINFYDRREVKEIIAYLKFMNNRQDELSFEKIINIPKRYFTPSVMDKLSRASSRTGRGYYELLKHPQTVAGFNPDNCRYSEEFVHLIEKYSGLLKGPSMASHFREFINEIKFRERLGALFPDPKNFEDRVQSVEELISGMEAYSYKNRSKADLSGFLNTLMLESAAHDNESEKPSDKAVLMTYHSSKGLEYPVVFLAGLDDEVMPSRRAVEEGSLEEERRLFYVGLTRAETLLFLSWPKKKIRYGKEKEVKKCRFLKDIPEELIDASIQAGGDEDEKAEKRAILADLQKLFN
ncbi:MAG: ATP-dependent helicase [Fibrobacterota bacterium]